MSEAAILLAHLMLAAPFAVSGVEKALAPRAAIREVEALERPIALPVPAPLVLWIVIAVQLAGAAMLLVPGLSVIGALLLIAFLAPTTVIAHPFWSAPPPDRASMRNHFFLNLALGGGLLLVALRPMT